MIIFTWPNCKVNQCLGNTQLWRWKVGYKLKIIIVIEKHHPCSSNEFFFFFYYPNFKKIKTTLNFQCVKWSAHKQSKQQTKNVAEMTQWIIPNSIWENHDFLSGTYGNKMEFNKQIFQLYLKVQKRIKSKQCYLTKKFSNTTVNTDEGFGHFILHSHIKNSLVYSLQDLWLGFISPSFRLLHPRQLHLSPMPLACFVLKGEQ